FTTHYIMLHQKNQLSMKKIFTSCILLIISLIVHGQDGTLDENFGQSGTRYYNNFNANSSILSMIRSGDFLYAAGYTKQGTKEEFSILKMDLNGDPISNFGNNGLIIYSIGNGFARADVILEQPDGKMVAAGWARLNNKDLYTLVRFYP